MPSTRHHWTSHLSDNAIDLAAASRISSRVELLDIRLTEIRATCQPGVSEKHPLQPTYSQECMPAKVEGGFIEVVCSYNFKVRSSDLELAEAHMKYRIVYKLLGDQPTEPSDIEQFARANGAYHSWPFVRETIYNLTAKMGFPPYTLPVLSFLPRPKPSTSASPSESASPSLAVDESSSQPESSEAS